MSKKNGQRLSRRKFIGTTVGAAAAVSAGPIEIVSWQARGGGAAPPDQEITLTNGRIHTLDARHTIATSVTIRNGRFTAINARPAGNSRVIDLKGRTVVPGLVEGHVHNV